jgi:hypothetical protein
MNQNKSDNSKKKLTLDVCIDPLLKLAAEGEIKGFMVRDFWEAMKFGRDPTSSRFYFNAEMKILEENFKRFCAQVKDAGIKDYSKPPADYSIPPILHFIWGGSKLPERQKSMIDTWRRCHPGWDIRIWDDKAIENFTWTNSHIKQVFEKAKLWGEKSDPLRYDILYQIGGVYADADMICFKSFNDLISQDVKFFSGQEKNKAYGAKGQILSIAPGLVGSVKGNPIIKFCLDNLKSVDEAPFEGTLSRTGPQLFSRAGKHELQFGDPSRVLVLPCSYFYPFPFFDDHLHKRLSAQEVSENYVSPESMTIHLWEQSLTAK